MAHFIRQLHIMSSLKSGSDSEKLFPFYKIISPVLAVHPAVRKLHTQEVGKNLELKTQDKRSEDSSTQQKEKRNLAVIFSWMLAKGTHIDKYCNLYITRGFDVLTVKLSPQQMLFPATGSQVVASSILDYINANKQYDKVLVHAFSVGGYLMGEIFVKLQENREKYEDFTNRVVGMILDSAVDFEGINTGFPRAISKNPLTIKVLEWYISAHMALMYNVSTKHYLRASKFFHNTPLKCPALFLVSDGDKVGTPVSNRNLASSWESRGVECSMKCWKKSGHVTHMHFYQDEYIAEIDQFLSKLKLHKSS